MRFQLLGLEVRGGCEEEPEFSACNKGLGVAFRQFIRTFAGFALHLHYIYVDLRAWNTQT